MQLLDRLRTIYHDYPRQFWLLAGASFIDMTGNALVFPFFALYLTDKFNVGMDRAGVIFMIFSATGMLGSTIGGALADRYGRKPIALTSLVTSALGNLGIALVTEFWMLYPLACTVGVVGSIGGPAWQAMMADILPEDKRAEGFGIIRMEFNLAVIFGPMLGGLLASFSYLLLFSVDAATSFITAAILLVKLRETRPQAEPGELEIDQETLVQTFRGYGTVLRDSLFVTFAVLGAVVWLVYFQMNTTLPVYLRDEHGIAPQGYGLLLSMNALMVVIMQFPITRQLRERGYAPVLVLAAGSVLYAIGFGMFGVFSLYAFFVMAMMIITLGEMIIVPIGQAVAVQLATDHMRGRYMAVFGFGFAIAGGLGPWLAGQVINHLGGEWVWLLGGVLAMASALGYLVLHQRLTGMGHEIFTAPPEAPAEGEAVSAQAA